MTKWDDDNVERPTVKAGTMKTDVRLDVASLEARTSKHAAPSGPPVAPSATLAFQLKTKEPVDAAHRTVYPDAQAAADAERSADHALEVLAMRVDPNPKKARTASVVELISGRSVSGWYDGSVPGFRVPGGRHCFLRAPRTAFETSFDFRERWLLPCIRRMLAQGVYTVIEIHDGQETERHTL